MANSMIQSGSKGQDVTRLQTLLNAMGYGLEVDGIFGAKTRAAVRDYQKSAGLAADGIVGVNTWGALNAWEAAQNQAAQAAQAAQTPTPAAQAPAPAPQPAPDTQALKNLEGSKPEYAQSQEVLEALEALRRYETQTPEEYRSPYAEELKTALERVLSRGQFSYDPAADPLYQQYRDQSVRDGRRAMQEAQAASAALTGGYGSSYAATAGAQAYQGQMERLGDALPGFFTNALKAYTAQGDELYRMLEALQKSDDTSYGRHRDDMGDYYRELDYYYNRFSDLSQNDYARYADALSAWQRDRDYYYGKTQDSQAQENWVKNYLLGVEKWEAEQAAAQAKASPSGGGGGGAAQTYGLQLAGSTNPTGDDSRAAALALLGYAQAQEKERKKSTATTAKKAAQGQYTA